MQYPYFGGSVGFFKLISAKTNMKPFKSFLRSFLAQRNLSLLILMAGLLYLPSCKNDEKIFKEGPAEYDAQVAYDWIDLQLVLTQKTPGFSPPVAARAFGYTGLGLYEAMRYGMEGYRSMAGQVNGFSASDLPEAASNKPHHWGEVANTAMAALLRGFYPNASDSLKSAITDLESKHNATFADEASDNVYERSVDLGTQVANAILAYAASDGQSQAYLTNFSPSFVWPVGEGLWRPTPPAYSNPLQPYWGDVRPFLSANAATAMMPLPPYIYDTTAGSYFMNDLMEVHDYVVAADPTQVLIARYWSDDPGKTFTPGGHSISIMRQVLEQENAKLDEVARVYAELGMALHDAFVSCWKAKFIHNNIRPVTAIQDLVDPAWMPLLTSPPFPEYPSGHAVNSGAACIVLTKFYGEGYAFTDRSHENRTDIDGTPRSFPSFEGFAMEAADSRIFGGIHFRNACGKGLGQGVAIGTNIHNLKWND